jgi:hypothetical protein
MGRCFSGSFFNGVFIRLYRTGVPPEINAPVLIDNGAPLQSYLKKIENNGAHHIKEAREHRCT